MFMDLTKTRLAMILLRKIKMKLTKKKLEQLIMEEYVRRVSDEGRPFNYPEYADKLTNLAKDDYLQAASLADSLDEPLDIEFDPSEMETFPFINDDRRIRKFRLWMRSKNYRKSIMMVVLYEKEKAKQMFKQFAEETKDYLTHNTVLGGFRVDYIPFLDEETGAPLPLGSPRPFHRTNTYHYPRP